MEDISNRISDWLDNHPLFSINGMCKIVGVNTSNFMKYKAAKNIPEKFIKPIEKVLEEYGYIGVKMSEFIKPVIIADRNGIMLVDPSVRIKEIEETLVVSKYLTPLRKRQLQSELETLKSQKS